jgi:hypothetical protein
VTPIKHEGVPDCGSFEVRFADGRESRFFYFEGLLSKQRQRGENG